MTRHKKPVTTKSAAAAKTKNSHAAAANSTMTTLQKLPPDFMNMAEEFMNLEYNGLRLDLRNPLRVILHNPEGPVKRVTAAVNASYHKPRRNCKARDCGVQYATFGVCGNCGWGFSEVHIKYDMLMSAVPLDMPCQFCGGDEEAKRRQEACMWRVKAHMECAYGVYDPDLIQGKR